MLSLEDIAKKHTEWIRIAVYLSGNQETAQEVVQSLYLRLAEIELREGTLTRLQNTSGEVNTVYIFKAIQNLIYNQAEKKPTTSIDNLSEKLLSPTELPTLSEQTFSILIKELRKAISELEPYEQMLLELSIVYGKSFRQIETETGIPYYSVFNSIKNAKAKIRNKTRNAYQNYRDEEADKETFNRFGRHNTEDNSSDWD